ncbi:hypothetical protein SCHPADRAFT_861029 [Schizopora paradoxa]|uniref:Yeast cell wall synthesis Kre9/Knh1-like N-terminal domain-containing protein n=1 Tax=Schizopora paradoxa TaxID=27342 RepID=A0A0H2R4M4_9AGAM|nr:hypothetical protein SCHPADRAFT_861029 [Schizopora paradoxa]
MFTSTFAVLSLAAAASATVFITDPTASTTCSGGQVCQINWQDDGATPSLAQFGAAEVFLGIGNAQQQTMLQTISPSVNVSTTSAIQFTVDPNAGGNSNDYFIRVQSIALKDASNPQFPALSFSAKFTLNNMKGSFNASVQSEIDGLSTAPLGGSATSASGATSASAGSRTSGSTASKTGSSTSTSTAKSTGAASASGAERVVFSGFAGAVALFAAVFALAL